MRRLEIVLRSLLALFAASGMAQTFSSLSARPVLETKLAGRTLLTLNQGDFDSPALSPDGTRLAYVSKFTKGHFDLADIFIRDLRNSSTVLFIDSKRMARVFGAGKSSMYVTVRWPANDRLLARVSDGDEGGMDASFEVHSGRVLRKKYWPGPGEIGDDSDQSPAYKKAFAKLGGEPDSLPQAVINEIKTGPHRVVLPVRMADGHRELWSLDTRNEYYRNLLADLGRYSLSGGFRAGKWTVVLLSSYDEEARSAQLVAWNGPTVVRTSDLQLEYRPQDYHLDYSWAKGPFSFFSLANNELGIESSFLWDGANFYYVNDIEGVSTPSIDAAGQKICEVISNGGHHVIVMKELLLPSGELNSGPTLRR